MFNPLTWFVDPLMEVGNLLNDFGKEYWGLLLVLLVLNRALSNLRNNANNWRLMRRMDREPRPLFGTHVRTVDTPRRATAVGFAASNSAGNYTDDNDAEKGAEY